MLPEKVVFFDFLFLEKNYLEILKENYRSKP